MNSKEFSIIHFTLTKSPKMLELMNQLLCYDVDTQY